MHRFRGIGSLAEVTRAFFPCCASISWKICGKCRSLAEADKCWGHQCIFFLYHECTISKGHLSIFFLPRLLLEHLARQEKKFVKKWSPEHFFHPLRARDHSVRIATSQWIMTLHPGILAPIYDRLTPNPQVGIHLTWMCNMPKVEVEFTWMMVPAAT